MNATVAQLLDAGVRWLHVVAGVGWVGQLLFFNLVNSFLASTSDAGTGRKVSPEMAGARAHWLHLGAILGSVMMMNVWMRISPAQRRIRRGLRFGRVVDRTKVRLVRYTPNGRAREGGPRGVAGVEGDRVRRRRSFVPR